MQKRKGSAGKTLDVERKAKEILLQTKSLQTYNIVELTVLLTYYQVKGLSGMKKHAMAEKWKEILQSQQDAPIFMKWSANDQKKCQNSPQSQSLQQTQHWGNISR